MKRLGLEAPVVEIMTRLGLEAVGEGSGSRRSLSAGDIFRKRSQLYFERLGRNSARHGPRGRRCAAQTSK
jgi:hypothetical protein